MVRVGGGFGGAMRYLSPVRHVSHNGIVCKAFSFHKKCYMITYLKGDAIDAMQVHIVFLFVRTSNVKKARVVGIGRRMCARHKSRHVVWPGSLHSNLIGKMT